MSFVASCMHLRRCSSLILINIVMETKNMRVAAQATFKYKMLSIAGNIALACYSTTINYLSDMASIVHDFRYGSPTLQLILWGSY